MKTLFFMLVMTLGCAKDRSLDDNLTDEADETATPTQEQLEPVGVIPADDCQHIDFGDKACNFRLWDQNEDTWDLYEHKGDVILLDFSTSWCPPCQAAGHYMQALQDTYDSEGVQIVTILIDGPTGGVAPTIEDIDIWVADHNITSAPVLQGSRDKMFDTEAIEGYSIAAFPTYIYIGRDMKFYAGHVGFSDDYVRQKIEEGL